jgi:hypothetical protein
MEQAALELDALGQSALVGRVDGFLAHDYGRAREPGDLVGGLHSLVNQLPERERV